jgi:archaeosine synthase
MIKSHSYEPLRITDVVTDRKNRCYIIYDPPFYRAEFEEAFQYIVNDYYIPPREIAIFIPCALRKPYSSSPSHKLFHRIIDEALTPDRYHLVIFGTCGVVPSELELMFPYRHYQYMLGKCTATTVLEDFHRIETKRLLKYLEKTKDTYQVRIAYCIGPFRRAMEAACEQCGIEVVILPSQPVIAKLYDIDCPFPEGSLSMEEYIAEFSRGLHAAGSK